MATITYIKDGNIFDSNCDAIVNPVNCVGVMGAGLAKQFKEKYPHMFWEYKQRCESGGMSPSMSSFHKTYPEHYELGNPKYIVNFATKNHWKDKSKLQYIDNGMAFLAGILRERIELKSIAFPKLGCGLGGLDWEDVKPIMERRLKFLDLEVEIYV